MRRKFGGQPNIVIKSRFLNEIPEKLLKTNFTNINKINSQTDNNHILFSESPSRIIVTVEPSKKEKFEKHFKKNQLSLIGKVIKSKKILFKMDNKDQFKIDINFC